MIAVGVRTQEEGGMQGVCLPVRVHLAAVGWKGQALLGSHHLLVPLVENDSLTGLHQRVHTPVRPFQLLDSATCLEADAE